MTSNSVAMVYISMIDLFYQDGQSRIENIDKNALADKNPELWYAMIN